MPRPLEILSIEDDAGAASEIGLRLRQAGHRVTTVTSIDAGQTTIFERGFDVITLDRMLPDGDGLGLLERLRAAGNRVPVLVISALSDLDERVRGLRAGGDDYLGKPFAASELVARVEVLARRGLEAEAVLLEGGGIRLNLLTQTVSAGDSEERLKPAEARLLEFLMRHPGSVLARAVIFDKVFGYRFNPGSNLIDVHMGQLRRKIEVLGVEVPIETVRGEGFRFLA